MNVRRALALLSFRMLGFIETILATVECAISGHEWSDRTTTAKATLMVCGCCGERRLVAAPQ